VASAVSLSDSDVSCLQGNKGRRSPSTGKEDHVQGSWRGEGGMRVCLGILRHGTCSVLVGPQTNTKHSNPSSTNPLGKPRNRPAFCIFCTHAMQTPQAVF
jgi:hypothetical protein